MCIHSRIDHKIHVTRDLCQVFLCQGFWIPRVCCSTLPRNNSALKFETPQVGGLMVAGLAPDSEEIPIASNCFALPGVFSSPSDSGWADLIKGNGFSF